MIKKSWQKIKYIDNEILITFKGLLVAQVCLRPGYAPLRIQKINPALPNHKYHAKQQAMNKLFKPCWSQWELFLNSCNLVLNPFIQGGTAFPWKTMWFFKLLFGCSTATSGPLSMGQPHSSDEITEFCQFRLVHRREARNEVGSLSPTKSLVRFELGTFWF